MFHLVIFSCLFLATFAASANFQKKIEVKILGGDDTNITMVPHQVSVQFNRTHWCGGSIVGPRQILTAAHCVERKNETLFSIRAGSSYYDKEGQEVDVIKIIKHPKFNTFSVDYDAAVLVLKESLTCSEAIKMVTLAKVEPNEGESVLVSGWGSLGEGKGMSEFLQSATVTVVSRDECKKMYGSRSEITDRMFCAGHTKGEKDSCEGDNGGPAVVNGTLAGIVSWGDGCGNENVPGVYTNIAKITNWITEKIQE